MSLHSQVLVLDRHAPHLGRAWAASVLGVVVPPDGVRRENIVEDIQMCTSELVTDALLANSTRATLALQVGPGFVRLSLADAVTPRASREPGVTAQLMGWGMVRALSQDSGIQTSDGAGRELWAIFRDMVCLS